jgi:RHS repeat-associated protein
VVTKGYGPPSSLSFANGRNQPDGWCYDASGNLLSKSACGVQNYFYDAENRMIQAGGTPKWCATGSGTPATACYFYDGNGMRVQKSIPNGVTTTYLYSGSRDIAEYDVSSGQQPNPASPSREFIYADALPGDGLVASIANGATTYFHSDHLSWRVETNSSGVVIGQQGHYPFGESWYSTNGNEFVFTTYQRDQETGFDYALARYYDSGSARFCSVDPLGGRADDPQSWNRYAYVQNDPTNHTDPSGKGFWSSFLIALAGIAVEALLPVVAPELFAATQGATDGATDVALVTSTNAETGSTLSLGVTQYTSQAAGTALQAAAGAGAAAGAAANPFGKTPQFKGAKDLVRKPECANWLTSVTQKAGENLKGGPLTPEESQLYVDEIKGIPATLDTTPTTYQQIANPINSEGFRTNAEVFLNNKPPSMTLYKGFFDQTFLGSQSQIILHEGVHLATFFNDRALATAATGKTYLDTALGRRQASHDFQSQLEKSVIRA